MKVIAVLILGALAHAAAGRALRSSEAASVRVVEEPEEEGSGCAGQKRFDILMCKSFMCTDCLLSWCTEQCQAWQLEFPGCRCEDWPESRKSFSTGDFAGKGTFGDSGDYSKKGEGGE